MHRRLLVGVLVVAVVGVGLASAGGQAGTESPTNNTSELAPGLTADGVTDPFALSRAHQGVLRNTSYTVAGATTHRYANGTLISQWSNTVAVDGEASSHVSRETVRNASETLGVSHRERAIWSNGSVALAAERFAGGDVEYSRMDGRDCACGKSSTQWELVYAVFEAANTTVAGEVERDGTTLYRVVATEVRADSRYAETGPFTLEALVDSRGVVRSLQVTYSVTYLGDPAVVTQDVRVTEIGNTTVERPSWYEHAVENTTA